MVRSLSLFPVNSIGNLNWCRLVHCDALKLGGVDFGLEALNT